MKASSSCLNFLKSHESLRLRSYLDPVNVWTIGYGHTATARANQSIDICQAESLLKQDVAEAESRVLDYVVGKGVPLQQNQFDAFVSLVFNVGYYNIFLKEYDNGYQFGSTLYNRLRLLDYKGCADRFPDFVKAGGRTLNGLVSRRQIEKKMFLNHKY